MWEFAKGGNDRRMAYWRRPDDSDLAARAEADVAELRGDLWTACLEPFADLPPSKRQALLRRLERLKRSVTVGWYERPALSIMLMLWWFLQDLTDREVLILGEGSAMDRATRKLMPMCEYGFGSERTAFWPRSRHGRCSGISKRRASTSDLRSVLAAAIDRGCVKTQMWCEVVEQTSLP